MPKRGTGGRAGLVVRSSETFHPAGNTIVRRTSHKRNDQPHWTAVGIRIALTGDELDQVVTWSSRSSSAQAVAARSRIGPE
ncbi:hypothetical protein Axi01nite_70830 [Actinoplanes xinjiangensis]|nr:hypothetical protein Axi01nite_70830 [Actinoplanes xinjiangensis]